MSHLQIFPAAEGGEPLPTLASNDPELIAGELNRRGIGFERWPARAQLPEGATPGQILEAYAEDISTVQRRGRYPTVDAIRLTPEHPERATLRRKFLAEHIHSEDEVRFFVEGRGLFCLHLGEEVLQVLCEADDWISVPAGTKHWFDMGAEPRFTAIRFFDNPEGWVAQFTGDPIAQRFPLLEGAQNEGE
ncbi:MAG: 1,2-dihydroxy-3-keto-5-methylthiopentene dioxygenase [Cyanobium sp.]